MKTKNSNAGFGTTTLSVALDDAMAAVGDLREVIESDAHELGTEDANAVATAVTAALGILNAAEGIVSMQRHVMGTYGDLWDSMLIVNGARRWLAYAADQIPADTAGRDYAEGAVCSLHAAMQLIDAARRDLPEPGVTNIAMTR